MKQALGIIFSIVVIIAVIQLMQETSQGGMRLLYVFLGLIFLIILYNSYFKKSSKPNNTDGKQ
ncbi:MAG: hypothetical protein ACTHMC_18475 [Pseudobacter sp.]|uniref:hypothetical protein n=1 Tax=Pseudobacter sp. TaxID=2045420 RepID=UPI003F7E56CD